MHECTVISFDCTGLRHAPVPSVKVLQNSNIRGAGVCCVRVQLLTDIKIQVECIEQAEIGTNEGSTLYLLNKLTNTLESNGLF